MVGLVVGMVVGGVSAAVALVSSRQAWGAAMAGLGSTGAGAVVAGAAAAVTVHGDSETLASIVGTAVLGGVLGALVGFLVWQLDGTVRDGNRAGPEDDEG